MKFENYSKSFLHFYTESIPDLVLKHIPKAEFALADLGAGDGALLAGLQLGGYLEKASNVVAVDISKERCDRLSRISDFEVLCSDVTNMPTLKSKAYDFIVCTQVIEHVDEDSLLNEIKRLLADDGKLYIASLIRKKHGWWYYRTKNGKWGLDPTHLREYASQKEFESVLKKAGFNVVDVSVTSLGLSVMEFLIRRVIVPVFKAKDINDFFLRHRFMNFLRKKMTIHPPGYYIIEAVVLKR